MQAINEARERLQWLAQTRSTMRRNKPAAKQYRASSVRGGVVAEGGPSVLGDQSRWDWSKQQAAATQAGPGGSGFGGGPGGGAAYGPGGNGAASGQPGVIGRPVSASGGMSGAGLGRGNASSGLGSGEGNSDTSSSNDAHVTPLSRVDSNQARLSPKSTAATQVLSCPEIRLRYSRFSSTSVVMDQVRPPSVERHTPFGVPARSLRAVA